MAKTKTFKTDQDVTEFINSVADEKKRTDSFKLIETMSGITGFKPYMWGPTIIGFVIIITNIKADMKEKLH